MCERLVNSPLNGLLHIPVVIPILSTRASFILDDAMEIPVQLSVYTNPVDVTPGDFLLYPLSIEYLLWARAPI